MHSRPRASLPEIPPGHFKLYFVATAVAAALFGGVVYWALIKYDPIGKLLFED